MQFPEPVAHGNGLDTVLLYAHERMAGALSCGAALGYVEADHRAEEADARVYPRIIAPAL